MRVKTQDWESYHVLQLYPVTNSFCEERLAFNVVKDELPDFFEPSC
jgi:hypothetical protein